MFANAYNLEINIKKRVLKIFSNIQNSSRSVWKCITQSITPTCLGHSCGHLQGGALQGIETS